MKSDTLVDKLYLKNKGTYKIVNRYLGSLREYGLRMYKKYSDNEKIIYKPNKVN